MSSLLGTIEATAYASARYHRGLRTDRYHPSIVPPCWPHEVCMERARLAGTAKEAVLVALHGKAELAPVRDVIDAIGRTGMPTSVPAVYRALMLLEQEGFVVEGDPHDAQRAIRQFHQRREPGTKERALLRYRLTHTGAALAALLKLRRGDGPIDVRELVKASHLMYAALAAPDAPGAPKPRR